MTTLSETDWPGRTCNSKYGRDRPLAVGLGDKPNGAEPATPRAPLGRAGICEANSMRRNTTPAGPRILARRERVVGVDIMGLNQSRR
jgi:hypothetical protein